MTPAADDASLLALAERYLLKDLSPAELKTLTDRLTADPELQAAFNEDVSLLTSLENSGKTLRFRSMVSSVATANGQTTPLMKMLINIRPYLRTTALAAGIALLASWSTGYYLLHKANKTSNTSQYQQLIGLKHDIEKIKANQSQLNALIADQKVNVPLQSTYSATGFALSTDGYIATNAHVVAGADSVYIQTSGGHYYRAEIVRVNDATDIAILKVTGKPFGNDMPYTIARGKSGLGARIFTLSYPGDDLVYSEGYVSSATGYKSDTLQYRLEVPSGPGTSGSPVIDEGGRLVGIVTGKESQSEGTTYAVSAGALLSEIALLPKGDLLSHLSHRNRLGSLSREAQIKKMEQLTCTVQVYK